MKKKKAWTWIAVSAAAVSIALAVRLGAAVRAPVVPPGAVAATPVRELVSAVPFRVARPFTHYWRREHPAVSSGYLLVLAVDPEYVRARETAEPVLYAGDQTVERVNHGEESGRVIAILPMETDASGRMIPDLSSVPFWFGDPDLPERIDANAIQLQRARGEKIGLRTFSAEEVARATKRGGEALALARREDLEARAGLLVLEHAPEDRDLADGLLVPSGK